VGKRNTGSFGAVLRGWNCLRRHDVEANILCTIHVAKAAHPHELYRSFRTSCRRGISS
jgi:uncharacterized protein